MCIYQFVKNCVNSFSTEVILIVIYEKFGSKNTHFKFILRLANLIALILLVLLVMRENVKIFYNQLNPVH